MATTQQSPWWGQMTQTPGQSIPSLAWNPYRDAQQQAIQPQRQQSSIPTYAGMDGAAQPAGSWWQNQSSPALAGQQAQTSGSGFAKLAGTGATAGAQTAAGGVSTGGTASSQSVDGYTQGSGQSFQTTDYASNATSEQWEQWLNESGNLGGQTWNGRQWTGGGPVAVGSGVLGASGMKTTVGYDARRDTSLYEFGGVANSESNWHRVNRWAMDNARDGGMAPQDAYNAALARLKSEAIARGADLNTLGFDLTNVQAAPQGTTGTTIDPNSKSPLPAGQQVPGGTTTTTGGGAGGVTNVPAGYVGGKGVGGYDWRAILNAQGDQKAGYDMLTQYMTGSTDEGTGPFAGFMKQLYGPLVTSLINAASANNGQAPTNIDDIMARLSNPSGKGADGQSIYDYLGNAGRSALQKTLTKGDVSFQDTANATALYSPLLTTGFNPIARNQYDRQQQNALVGMQAPSYWDMAAGLRGDYGAQLARSQFYKNWWQR